jgi:hypothetical protein
MNSTFLVVSGVIDAANHKKFDLKVEYLNKFESIYETVLTRGSGAQIELFDEKNQMSTIS